MGMNTKAVCLAVAARHEAAGLDPASHVVIRRGDWKPMVSGDLAGCVDAAQKYNGPWYRRDSWGLENPHAVYEVATGRLVWEAT